MYPDFCQAGKVVHKMLAKAGGVMMIPLEKADEAVDATGAIAQWLKLVKALVLPASLEAAIEARLGVSNEPLKYQIKWAEESPSRLRAEAFSWPESKSSLCVINDELFAGEDITKRSARRIGFKLAPGVSYETGDHLAVSPLNSIEFVYRFAACFSAEFEVNARSRGETKLPKRDLINWQLQQPFEVECVDNGQVYPAPLSFEPNTLLENLQVGISLSISESSAYDLIFAIKHFIPHEGKQVENETVKKFISLSDLILEGGKEREHQVRP